MRYFTITTLGCKVNQYDGLAVVNALGDTDWAPVRPGQTPDLVLINTCCVTATAKRKSRQAIRRAVRSAPNAAVCVLGCYCTLERQKIRELLQTLRVPENKAFLTGQHENLALTVSEILKRGDSLFYETAEEEKGFSDSREKEKNQRGDTGPSHFKELRKKALRRDTVGTQPLGILRKFPGHQRAFVKVQDGCDAFCNYCIVPYARPRVWSRREEDILAECRQLVEAGHKEIVLCGVFLGAYGRPTTIRRKWDDTPSPLPALVQAVSEIPSLWRVRLSSLEPGDMTDDLLVVLQNNHKVAPHLHLPLQSGSDNILRRMNRQYRTGEFRQTIARLRNSLDRPAITTDIIVGYPGETNDDFAETLSVAREAGFAKIHIFPFSALEPTGAWLRRAEAPTTEVVRERQEQLAALETELAQTYRRQFVGETMEGLVEHGESVGRATCCTRKAMTDRYLTVTFPALLDNDLTGQVVPLRIKKVTEEGLAGELTSLPVV